MSDYKDTLNLPVTDFPMKAGLNKQEPERLAWWDEHRIYDRIRQIRAGAPKFVLHDGPPYANGHLHCGHALNKILKDITVKSRTLMGMNAPYVPGWDCHGLPIELNVEKKFGKSGDKLDANAFRKACRDYAQSQLNIQREEFKRLGVFGEWDNPYATMQFSYEANIIRALGKILARGHIVQGFKPVHWCIDCASALAEAEVDYEDKTSPSIDVAFNATHPEKIYEIFGVKSSNKPVIFPIWTTTPWTLPANEAVCLNPELTYALVETNDKFFVIAEDLYESTMARYQMEGEIKAHILGDLLLNQDVQHPFMKRVVPVIMGSHVTVDSGTGCVHTAPSHGPDDYQVGLQYGLPLRNLLSGHGVFNQDVELVGGVYLRKADNLIIEGLKERQALLCQTTIQHSYPHCWRHKTPVLFMATPQWFISMDKAGLRKELMNSVDAVRFIPDWGKARILDMIDKRPDWCISRQRSWGTPIPFFLNKKDKSLHPNTSKLLEEVALLVEKSGIDAWFNLDPKTLLGNDAEHYEKISDTLDVWFDSGVSHFAVLSTNKELSMPADIYLEGSDQHRGWFNSSLTTAVAMGEPAPYKTLLTHGYTVDSEGKKLSKSKGNYVALDKLIEQYGADVIRLWVSSTDFKNEVSISDEIMKRTSEAYRRIRNTARFLLANLFDFDASKNLVSWDSCLELDKWAIKRTQLLQDEIIQAYDDYQFHQVFQKIHNFCAIDLGSFYLDIIKDRQYTMGKDSLARRSCQTAMFHMLQALVRWLSPICSFTAEEIWSNISDTSKAESVFLTQWYDAWPLETKVDMEKWAKLQEMRDDVNKAMEVERQKGVIGANLAAEVTIFAKEPEYTLLTSLGDELRFFLITSEAKVLLTDEVSKDTNSGIRIEVTASTYEKCERCWHRRDDVGINREYPTLCIRCVDNCFGSGEKRLFA